MISQRSRWTQDRAAFELQLWALSRGISAWMADLAPCERCRVAGLVQRLLIEPQAGVIESVVSDGTGAVVAQWRILGTNPRLTVTPGRAVVVDGVPMIAPDRGLVLRDPLVEVHLFPEVT